MNFGPIEKIAAALLYEGYILYPYRPTAIKNRQRWNFGTLYPRVYAEAQNPQEPYRLIAECLVLDGVHASLDLKISFLQLVRQPQSAADRLPALTDPSLAWDEAVERSFEQTGLSVDSVFGVPLRTPIDFAVDLRAVLTVSAQRLPSGACRLHIELENATMLVSGGDAQRDEALPQSMVSAHILLGMTDGEFVSLLEPAESYSADARACTNGGVFPVLAGEEPDRSMMLVSPIILYDYPKIAPESAGDFFDGTEMDEMLTLRVLTLTDEEKELMRNGDPRARRILERTEALSGGEMLQAHGTIRQMRELQDGRGDIERASWKEAP
jgi:hypothetical protein